MCFVEMFPFRTQYWWRAGMVEERLLVRNVEKVQWAGEMNILVEEGKILAVIVVVEEAILIKMAALAKERMAMCR